MRWIIFLLLVMVFNFTSIIQALGINKVTNKIEVISIETDAKLAIEKAYALLVERGYYDTAKYLKKVIYNPSNRRSEVIGKTATFYLKEHPIKDMSQTWLTSVLLHEAWHLRLRHEAKSWYGLEGERTCLSRQVEYLKKYGNRHEIRWAEYILTNIEDLSYQWWKDNVVIPPLINQLGK